ncbi:low specificity L-threonine aldolase [Halopenitus sp. POP-27]|uniref:threonine aldolase family protein n=1 Tax=Halopenitus sp. POP-27 TaxID=2994425 RepID=UPI0024699683|nr:low specificity L-threonine aldolase [Halopenitus sp. POP-27]
MESELDVDLRSDTVTRPSAEMREAAATAAVGDDVYRGDPTVIKLEGRVAETLEMEAALYVPSGTMGNQIAVQVHTDPGDEVLLEAESHIYRWELGGAAALSGAQTRPIDAGERGVPTPEQVEAGLVDRDLHRAGTGLFALENTHNYRGGRAIPKARIDDAAAVAHDHDVPVHVDGARLFNAAVALDTSAAELVESVDSAMVCLSKGLGAPVGSMLVGPETFIEEARRVRKLFGGGMRQAGLIAAPGLCALENVDRLADDHANAARLARGLDDLDGLEAADPETNIVVVDVSGTGRTAEQFLEDCTDAGIGGVEFDDYTVRFTTHLDVDREDVETAIDRIATIVE